MGGGASEETFLSNIEFAAVNLSLYRFYAQFFLRQFYYCMASNTYQDIIVACWRDQLAIYNQENILPTSFRDRTIRGKHNRLVKAILNGFWFS